MGGDVIDGISFYHEVPVEQVTEVPNFTDFLSQFMADNMTMFIVTVIFIFLDILSGLVCALINKDFSSTVMRKGLGHKLGYVFIMCAVAVLQVAMFDPNFHMEFDFPMFNIVCGFIIFMECSSILENASMLNPQLNEIIGKFFNRNVQ